VNGKAALGAPRSGVVLVVAVALVSALVGGLVFVATAAPADPRPVRTVSIAIVGDSYTAGTNSEAVWPTLLAQRTGWPVANFALPGAGYAADGQGAYTFSHQVDRAQAARPRTIVIVGGLGDEQFAWSGRISAGAMDAVDKIKVAGQQALVIGPTYYETPVPASVRAVSDQIHQVADFAGVPFLDALDPPWLTADLMQPDLSGPTDQGQSVIADKVAAWLRNEVAE
jgi:GDSL-like Lipase/Acylhydrolase family